MIGKGKTIGSIAAKWSRSRSSKAGLQSQSVVSPDSSKPESMPNVSCWSSGLP